MKAKSVVMEDLAVKAVSPPEVKSAKKKKAKKEKKEEVKVEPVIEEPVKAAVVELSQADRDDGWDIVRK